jgi:hypothetical protein
VERIIHRLVRKHIAGTTMDSALDVAKSLNGKSISASLTFLSSNVTDRAKAKYITTTYSELVRRIARAGIKAGVHVELEQLGSGMGSEIAVENFKEIVEVGNRYGVFIWAGADGLKASAVSPITRMKGVGLAVSQERADDYAKYGDTLGAMKLMFKDYSPDKKNGIVKRVEALRKDFQNIVLSYLPEKSISQILKSKHKSDVCIEFEYGYSEKKIGKAIRRWARVSVLVPFGKDWIKYAMTNAPEGYMRFVAGRLLKEGDVNDTKDER